MNGHVLSMFTDFKFKSISQAQEETTGHVTVWEGDMQMVENENPNTFEIEKKNIYVRSNVLREIIVTFMGYVSKNDLCSYFRKILAEDTIREPIPEQIMHPEDTSMQVIITRTL